MANHRRQPSTALACLRPPDATAIPAGAYGEIPVTVTTPAPGGGQSNPYTLTVYQTLKIQTASLLYEPVSKLLNASVPSTAATNANTVLPIDPPAP
jgi:hypothetical protein